MHNGKIIKNLILVLIFVWLVVFDVKSYQKIVLAADDVEETRDDLKDLEEKKAKEEKKLNQYNSTLQVTQSQINVTASQISKTETEISRKVTEVNNLNQRIELNQEILRNYMQGTYYADQDFLIKLLLDGIGMAHGMSGDFDQMLNTNERILFLIKEIKKDKEDLEFVKAELAEKKEEHEDILYSKQVEKKEIVGDIAETKLTISQLDAKMSKLRSILSGFLGRAYSLDDVIDTVKYAEKKTGVRKQFLFAMLDKETDLGRFTGGCTYKKSKMGDANAKIFKSLCNDLGYDYNKMKVSCPLSYGIGGAMGVAQFMPTTWVGYKDKIVNYTGNSPADPWDLKDGIMGMALKLKAAGGDKKSGEYKAAAIYYCGSRLERTVCKNYANTVISWSKSYDDYF